MEKVVLNATKRTLTVKKVGRLRREGKLPAVMYGHNFDPVPITLDLRETTRSMQGLTSSSLVTINLDGKDHAALIRDKQRDYIRGNYKHLDFQVVSMTEKLRTSVMIELVGTSPAVKEYNGVVVSGLDSIEVECFPQDLPERFTVDVSILDELGQSIHVRDLDISEKLHVISDPDDMIALVTSVKEEKEEEEITEEESEEPEVIEKGKKEEEEDE
jgi:large subunit ribosomal protein L25